MSCTTASCQTQPQSVQELKLGLAELEAEINTRTGLARQVVSNLLMIPVRGGMVMKPPPVPQCRSAFTQLHTGYSAKASRSWSNMQLAGTAPHQRLIRKLAHQARLQKACLLRPFEPLQVQISQIQVHRLRRQLMAGR